MIKTIMLSTLLVLTTPSESFASKNARGDWHQVKMKNFRDTKETLYHATKNSTIGISDAAAIIGVESEWVSKAKNKSGSSAKGYFQYLDSTWIAERRLFAQQAKVSRTAKSTDGIANIRIGVLGLERNKQILSERTGIREERLSLGDIYIAHLLGVDKAAKVINGNPNALMTKYVKITKGNRNLYKTKKGITRTVSQFRVAMNVKLTTERRLYEKELMNYQLTKLIETIETKELASNSQPNARWYVTN